MRSLFARQWLIGIGIALLMTLAVTAIASGAGRTENYQFKFKARDQAAAGALLPTRHTVGFDTTLVKGGQVKPDETPETWPEDACDGLMQKEHDLVVTADKEARFIQTVDPVAVDANVQIFATSRMARTDLSRSLPFVTRACISKLFQHQHATVMSFSRPTLFSLKGVGVPQVTIRLVLHPANASNDIAMVLNVFISGRVEAAVTTIMPMFNPGTPYAAQSVEDGQVRQELARLTAHPLQ